MWMYFTQQLQAHDVRKNSEQHNHNLIVKQIEVLMITSKRARIANTQQNVTVLQEPNTEQFSKHYLVLIPSERQNMG